MSPYKIISCLKLPGFALRLTPSRTAPLGNCTGMQFDALLSVALAAIPIFVPDALSVVNVKVLKSLPGALPMMYALIYTHPLAELI